MVLERTVDYRSLRYMLLPEWAACFPAHRKRPEDIEDTAVEDTAVEDTAALHILEGVDLRNQGEVERNRAQAEHMVLARMVCCLAHHAVAAHSLEGLGHHIRGGVEHLRELGHREELGLENCSCDVSSSSCAAWRAAVELVAVELAAADLVAGLYSR